jgi:branched-chain amino acid transport system permease protein
MTVSLDNSATLSRYRFHWAEPLFWIGAIAFYYLFPQYLAVGTAILILALFAVSYDLVIGFAGILTLGHGVYYGIGAYSAGLIAKFAWNEAITGAVAAGAVSAAVAAVLGPFVLRLRGLPLIMVTMGTSVIMFEAANKAGWLTGGDDGLTGFTMAPLLGTFRWSMFGHTKYLYALAVLFVLFYALRFVVASPFGVALQGIRENRDRMMLVGTPVLRHLVAAYVIAGGIAGIAGAVSAQTNAFAGLGVLSLDTTLDGLVVVVLGGIGSLYGSLIGAPVYVLVKHFSQTWNPFYWMFAIGTLLVFVVRFGRGGMLGLCRGALAWAQRFAARGSDQP